MKKIALISSATAALLLAACGDDETVTNTAPATDTTTNTTESQDDTMENQDDTMDNQDDGSTEGTAEETTISFREFNLDVEYEGNNNDFDVDYEAEQQIEASFQNEAEGIDLQGDDAYAELEPVVSEFTFAADTPDDEIVQTVLEGFGLDENFESFELDVTFEDGMEKEIDR